MTCSRCGSDRLFQFESSAKEKAPGHFPLVCRSCGQMTVGGVPLVVPSEVELQAQSLAEAAAQKGVEVRGEIAEDNDTKVEKYFARVYRDGYLDGFLRAWAFRQHNAKEGKLKRLRELWAKVGLADLRDGGCFIPSDLEEFDRLLTLGPVQD